MGKIKLIGVYDDGTRPRYGLPFDPRAPLRLLHRQPTTVELEVITPAGIPFPLSLGDQFALVAKHRNGCDPLPVLQVAGLLAPTRGPNFATFSITAADTEDLTPKHYQYDVWMVRSGVGTSLVPTSTLMLDRTVYAP